MGYRLMAWDGDFRTKDMFRASGREHANFAQKKAAHEAAERFMRTYPPRSEDARVILEKTSSRWGSTTEARWGKGPDGWTKTSGDPRRRRARRDCIGVHTHENMGRRVRDPGTREKVREIRKRFELESDALWAQYQSGKMTHAEYRKRIESIENDQRAALARARTSTSGDARRTRLTRSQQAYVHRKIRILRREHPEWKQKQVVAVAISYARRRRKGQ